MLIGEYLIKKSLITNKELQIALDEQKNTGDFLGQVLIQHHFLKEEDLLKAVSELFRIPFVSLKNEYIDWDLAMRFSASLVVERNCLPFRETALTITVAILSPLDAATVSRIEEQTEHKKAELVLVTSADMREALKIYQTRVAAKIKKLLGG